MLGRFFIRSEAPLGQQWGGNLPRVFKGCVANLARHLLANLLRVKLGHKPVHLLAHLLGLEVANLLWRVQPNVDSLVVALRRPGHELNIIKSA